MCIRDRSDSGIGPDIQIIDPDALLVINVEMVAGELSIERR